MYKKHAYLIVKVVPFHTLTNFEHQEVLEIKQITIQSFISFQVKARNIWE